MNNQEILVRIDFHDHYIYNIAIYDDKMKYYKTLYLHRLDGPAIQYAEKYAHYNQWYYKGEHIENIKSQREFEQYIKLRIFS